MNSTTFENNIIFDQISPVECYKLQVIGAFCMVLITLSTLSNGKLLHLFLKNKSLKSPINAVLFTICALNLLATLTELPLVAINCFSCRFLFGKFGCYFIACTLYFIGCFSIYLIAIVSFFRFMIIKAPFTAKSLNFKSALISMIISSAFALLLSAAPFYGWTRYTLEGANISCSIEWQSRESEIISYNIFIFVSTFFVPSIILIFSNLKIVFELRHSRKSFQLCHTQEQNQQQYENEKYLTIVSIFLIGFFMLSWAPYAFVAMYSTFINPNHIGPLTATLPSIFAKTWLLWPSIVYKYKNQNLKLNTKRKRFNESLRLTALTCN